jgi:hypothetical protein
MTDLPASQVDAAFGLPLPLPAGNAQFKASQDGFRQARDLALARAFALMQAAARVAYQEIIARDRPSGYAVVEVVRLYQAAQPLVRRIVYRYMDDVVQFALWALGDLSPVGSASDPHPGLYRDSHMLFIDGRNVPDAKSWQPGQVIHISNPEPYARKIELGTMKISVPPHVYEQAAQIVSAQYGDVASVQFLFMPVRFGSVRSMPMRTRRQGRPRRATGAAARQRRAATGLRASQRSRSRNDNEGQLRSRQSAFLAPSPLGLGCDRDRRSRSQGGYGSR